MKFVTIASRLNHLDRLTTIAEDEILRSVGSHQPALYHFRAGGHRMRLTTCLDACLALSLEDQDSIALACCIELLHNASLIHDDLQDNDEIRRGHPTVWAKYGKNIAICSGDLLLTKAFGVLSTITNTAPLAVILSEVQDSVSETIQGQCEDLSLTHSTSAIEYENIAARKSGPFIAMPLTLPLIAGGYTQSVIPAKQAVRCFAIAYQIADDIGDWQADAEHGHLNLVNIYRSKNNLNLSISMARQRALYLLRRCQKELQALPENCAIGIINAAKSIQSKLERIEHE